MDKDIQVTPQSVFTNRRTHIKAALGLLAGGSPIFPATASTNEVTPYKLATSYNNYYEFTTNKEMVKHLARDFVTSPWQVTIDGLVEKPLDINLEALNQLPQVNRTYPLRCVEGWSAIIPWSGIELGSLIRLAKPKPEAQYVRFIGSHNPDTMIGQRRSTLPWPYTEGLRLDEATHSLTLLATGMYGQAIANQNGAPVRLIVPWKYGYKSIKAITRIELTAEQPETSWSKVAPDEYGFYGNVNPNIPHPRWSQRLEVRLGKARKVRTQLLNGFANELQELYNPEELQTLW